MSCYYFSMTVRCTAILSSGFCGPECDQFSGILDSGSPQAPVHAYLNGSFWNETTAWDQMKASKWSQPTLSSFLCSSLKSSSRSLVSSSSSTSRLQRRRWIFSSSWTNQHTGQWRYFTVTPTLSPNTRPLGLLFAGFHQNGDLTVTLSCHGGGGGFFLACEDSGEVFLMNHSPPVLFFFFFYIGDQLLCTISTFFKAGVSSQ